MLEIPHRLEIRPFNSLKVGANLFLQAGFVLIQKIDSIQKIVN